MAHKTVPNFALISAQCIHSVCGNKTNTKQMQLLQSATQAILSVIKHESANPAVDAVTTATFPSSRRHLCSAAEVAMLTATSSECM